MGWGQSVYQNVWKKSKWFFGSFTGNGKGIFVLPKRKSTIISLNCKIKSWQWQQGWMNFVDKDKMPDVTLFNIWVIFGQSLD